jgi:hypothetical protein
MSKNKSYIYKELFNKSGILKEFDQWAVSQDLGIHLFNLINQNKFHAVLEFGTGLSTVIINKITKLHNIPHLAIEHDELYFKKIEELSRKYLISNLSIVLSKLKDINIGVDNYKFYDCFDVIYYWHSTIKQNKKRRKLLLLVDGPPSKTCYLARLPSLPIASQIFCNWDIHILLDDFNRVEEQEISRKWKNMFNKNIISWQENIEFKKGLLSFTLRN